MLDIVKSERKNRIVTAGNFKSYETTKYGIEVHSDIYSYRVIFYNERIVRVHQMDGDVDENPYSVIEQPSGSVQFSVEEHDESLVVTSDELDLVIEKNPVLFTFLDKNGKVLNEDDKGLGTQVQGEQKTVYKKLQTGERFVGLGEKTGPLDRRGKGYQNWNTDHFAYHIEADP